MLFCFFLGILVKAEWVSYVEVSEAELKIEGVNRVDGKGEFRKEGVLCVHEGTCQGVANRILMVNETRIEEVVHIVEIADAREVLGIFFIDDPRILWEGIGLYNERSTKEPEVAIFTIDKSKWTILYNIGISDEPVKVKINCFYQCRNYIGNCPKTWKTAIMLLSFSVLWFIVLATWVHLVYRRHYSISSAFHRLCTILMIVKILTILGEFLLLYYCPAEMNTYKFISLLKQEVKISYETSVFFLLIFLSTGWTVIRTTLAFDDQKFIAMLIVFLYILNSAINLTTEFSVPIVSGIMHTMLLMHCIRFLVPTIKELLNQVKIAQSSSFTSMLPSLFLKLRMILLFTVLSSLNLSIKLVLYFLFPDSLINSIPAPPKDDFFWLFQELSELLTIGGILYTYRPQLYSPYFYLDVYTLPQNSTIPLLTVTSYFSSQLVLITTPSSHYLFGEAVIPFPESI